MLKLFLTASGTSAFCANPSLSRRSLVCSSLLVQENAHERAEQHHKHGLPHESRFPPLHRWRVVVGSGIGHCRNVSGNGLRGGTGFGLCLSQMGALVPNSLWTFVGCLIGTFLYTRIQPCWSNPPSSFVVIEKLSSSSSRYPKTVMEATGMDYRVLAVLFASLLYTVVGIVNAFAPWRAEVDAWRAEVGAWHGEVGECYHIHE